MRIASSFLSLALGIVTFGAQDAHAETEPGKKALIENQSTFKAPRDAVQNRFFLKQERYEFSPILGFVPNDPMVNRFTIGMLIAYHFSESIAVEGAFIYSPDLGIADVKGLTKTLVQIAEQGSASVDFQQPIDKMELGATFAARWSPIYGKISLIGEGVLNFDVYGVAGLGMLSTNLYNATYDAETGVALSQPKWVPRVPVNLGLGINFFLNQQTTLKIDMRSYLYTGPVPQYNANEQVNEERLYNTLVTSFGASVFFPKMKPRMNY